MLGPEQTLLQVGCPLKTTEEARLGKREWSWLVPEEGTRRCSKDGLQRELKVQSSYRTQ